MPEKLSPKVLSWATDLQQNTIDQAELSSRFPFIPGHIALMPDAHLGYGVTIGSVIPTRGAIIPYAVGVDIGCGMAALQLDITARDLPDTLDDLLSDIEQAIPSRTHGEPTDRALEYLTVTKFKRHTWLFDDRQQAAASTQLGTLGGGNHFVEVCLDADESVWLVLHSGSRGIGNQLAQKHIAIAKGKMEKYYIELPDQNLAYLVENTPEFDNYMSDLNWSQQWAKTNRSVMLSAALKAFEDFMERDLKVRQGVNCHHNYTALENHGGKNLYITRKGAISAAKGQMGIIPGSMGTNSYIVRGLGNKSSYTSAPHGAGRAMSRKAARQQFTIEDFKEKMEGKVWLEDKANNLLDEHPDSYKDIHKVMRDSADLVEVVHELTQILNYKGT